MNEISNRDLDTQTAHFLGWHCFRASPSDGWDDKKGLLVFRGNKWVYWNPRHSHDDAQLLLDECERRGLMHHVAAKLEEIIGIWEEGNEYRQYARVLLAAPKQKTLAAWEVVEGLNKETKGE